MARSQTASRHFYLLVLAIALSVLLISGCTETQRAEQNDHGQEQATHPHDAGQTASAQMPAHDMRNMFPAVEEVYDKIEAEGLLVEFTVKSEDSFFGPKDVQENALATVKLRVTDATSGAPLTNTFPKAWIASSRGPAPAGSDPQQACEQQVGTYLRGLLTDRPEVDLNSFFILSLNNEATVSVIDPLVNLAGITQLYAMLELPKPGEDWALAQDQTRLFVTIPETGQVTAADMSSFRVIKTIDTRGVPVRVVFQPDEKYLWVGDDATGDGAGGVVVIDPEALETVARIPTGAGHHAIAFSADSRYAFVTNEKSGTVTVIETQSLRKLKDVQTGPLPVAIGVSAHDNAIYVANGGNGTIVVLDGSDFAPRATLQASPGLYALRFTSDGRWGFVTNPGRNEVYVLDGANRRLVHTLTVDGAPDQITLTETSAYLRSLDKPQVNVVQLVDLGRPEPPKVTVVAYGQIAPSQSPFQSVADTMFSAVRDRAMLISSPGDGQIYYHTEGATGPAGSFQGYGRTPRAVRVVDRGFRQEAPGIYSARFRVPESGEFVVATLLDNPRVVHCFRFAAKKNSAAEAAEPSVPPTLEFLEPVQRFKAGEEVRLQFALNDPTTQQRIAAREEVVVQIGQMGGNWSRRVVAQPMGDGLYEVRFTLPQPGLFTALFSSPSANIGLGQLPPLTMQVSDPSSAGEEIK